MLFRFITPFLTLFFFYSLTITTAHSASDHLLPKAEVDESGMHVQPWFYESFLNLGEDLNDAASQGKRLVIFWEQKGCPYCKRMHDVNLRIPRIVNYIKKHFLVIQLNLWGDREVTDFDGEVLSEKKLANKYSILYTPTIQFFPETLDKVAGRPGNKAEVVRIPGYFKPFHYYFLFQYAYTKAYEKQPNFQKWLGSIGDKLDKAGVKYDLWSDRLPPNLPEGF